VGPNLVDPAGSDLFESSPYPNTETLPVLSTQSTILFIFLFSVVQNDEEHDSGTESDGEAEDQQNSKSHFALPLF
jgi:hypothetical protein